MAHRVRYPPRRAVFSLTVAVCVVKPKSENSNQLKKCWNKRKIQPFRKKKLDFMELLPRFELGTSSLPNPRLLIFPFASCRQVFPQTQSYQPFADFSCAISPYLVGPSSGLFFYICRSFGRSFYHSACTKISPLKSHISKLACEKCQSKQIIEIWLQFKYQMMYFCAWITL